jgi:hypothetical protein
MPSSDVTPRVEKDIEVVECPQIEGDFEWQTLSPQGRRLLVKSMSQFCENFRADGVYEQLHAAGYEVSPSSPRS